MIAGIFGLAVAACSSSDISGQDDSLSTGTAESPQDLPGTESFRFQCEDSGAVEFRLLGPNTIDVRFNGESYVMQQQRAASGARYAGDGAEFWNKGDQAMVIVGGRHTECSRINDSGEGAER
jgi:membrane-bound inhibitor of C-type lysozyme